MEQFSLAGPDPFSKSFEPHRIDEFNQTDDFGRDSLGIFNTDHPVYGRESINLLPSDFGRESLGILNLNTLQNGRGFTDFNFLLTNDDNESNKIINDKFILNIDTIPEILVSNSQDNCYNGSLFNKAFIENSDLSTYSSVFPSFNSASLDNSYLSRISSRTSGLNDNLNNAFLESMKLFIRSNSSSCVPLEKNNELLHSMYRRIRSLPSEFEAKNDDFLSLEYKLDLNLPNLEQSEQKEQADSKEDSDEVFGFNDSVFIEARRLSYIIENGSMLETDMLDQIEQPEEFAETALNADEKDAQNSSGKISENLEESRLNTSLNKSSHSSVENCQSKNPIDIINTLSDLINNPNPTEKLKMHGQSLLSNLTDIFLSSTSTKSRSCLLDDSGHSSLENEPHETFDHAEECYEVLDLRKKSSSETNVNSGIETEEIAPLDLSMKSGSNSEKSFVSPKILPPKYTKSRPKLLTKSSFDSFGSNCSVSSNDSRSLLDLGRFKPKKVTEGVQKKGPMKAVLPLDSMSTKAKDSMGMKKDTRASLPKLKKTSTPINESQLKPMAQSTPGDTIPCNIPTSPLARPKMVKETNPKTLKYNVSSSKIQENHPSKVLQRRASNLELRKPSNNKRLSRSFSLDKESALKGPSKNVLKKTGNSFVLKENRMKTVGSRSSLKGKEN